MDQRDRRSDNDGPECERELRQRIQACIIPNLNVRWEDVIGLEEGKKFVTAAVVTPLKYPQLFGNKPGQIKPSKGVLLYGPPGTGKTELARAAATETRATFFNIAVSNLKDEYQGNSERLCRILFEEARRRKPSIIFIDEVETMLGNRDAHRDDDVSNAMVTEFLAQMDGVGHDQRNVVVLAACNRPWKLDEAILSRLDKKLHVSLPNFAARKEICKLNIEGRNDGQLICKILREEDYDALAKATEGYSGRDISGIVSGANMPMLGLLEQAEYFRRVTAPSADDSKVLCDDMLEPCDKNDVGAFPKKEKDLSETERKKVVLPKLTLERVLASVQSTKKSVSAKTVKKCAEWKEK